jgi:hypothetical protein
MSAYVGRYHRVRAYGLNEAGPPLVLDRKWGALQPYLNEEWWQTPQGLYVPVLRGGIGMQGRFQQPRDFIGTSGFTAGAQQTIALDSAYTSGSAGDAIAARLSIAKNSTLSDIYFFIVSYTGTAANVNDIDYEVRTGTVTTVTTSAGGLVATGTKNPASATGWIRISSLSAALTAGTFYYIILGDAEGNGTDFATLLSSHTMSLTSLVMSAADYMEATTTNGWTAVTLNNRASNLVLVFADGTIRGNPFTANAGSTSSTNRRGLSVDGFRSYLKVYGLVTGISANISGVELIFNDSTPGGATLASSTVLTGGTTGINGGLFTDPYLCGPGIPYRFVFTYGGAATVPNKCSVGSGADANILASMLGSGNWYWAEANGTTNWSNDDTTSWPFMGIMLEDFGPSQTLTSLT